MFARWARPSLVISVRCRLSSLSFLMATSLARPASVILVYRQFEFGELRQAGEVIESGVGDAGAPQRELPQLRRSGEQLQVVVGGRPIHEIDGDDLAGGRAFDSAFERFDAGDEFGVVSGRGRLGGGHGGDNSEKKETESLSWEEMVSWRLSLFVVPAASDRSARGSGLFFDWRPLRLSNSASRKRVPTPILLSA